MTQIRDSVRLPLFLSKKVRSRSTAVIVHGLHQVGTILEGFHTEQSKTVDGGAHVRVPVGLKMTGEGSFVGPALKNPNSPGNQRIGTPIVIKTAGLSEGAFDQWFERCESLYHLRRVEVDIARN